VCLIRFVDSSYSYHSVALENRKSIRPTRRDRKSPRLLQFAATATTAAAVAAAAAQSHDTSTAVRPSVRRA